MAIPQSFEASQATWSRTITTIAGMCSSLGLVQETQTATEWTMTGKLHTLAICPGMDRETTIPMEGVTCRSSELALIRPTTVRSCARLPSLNSAAGPQFSGTQWLDEAIAWSSNRTWT